ncbi:DUF58 domain-containing protein [Parendozoicomonas haliclonae]|uniref:Uncharacterized protein n=1 Tax=Parendozoicomonas haliclonae TaxID=1960125 RepID=A0A1X7AKQ6_9GAMM|nr:DUF58 domain-containing protein [Parendozoicomonas haliclonae]SMA47558.1 hypothetical protein EHSB41UT_02462 [Parendozoicomonas haliclonae]
MKSFLSQILLPQAFRNRWQRWLDRRIPLARSITLNQKSLFILPTAAGYGFLLVALLIFLAGVNYRNSLSYGVAFFMVALFQVALWQTWRNLAGLTLTARHGYSVHAGQRARLVVTVGSEQSGTGKRFGGLGVMVGWPDGSQPNGNLVRVDPQGQNVDVELTCATENRGVLRPGRLRVETTWPLGLFRTWSWVALDQSVLVWPSLIPVEPFNASSSQGEGHQSVAGGMDDFDGFRSFQPTDSAAQVDWKVWARSDELVVRQFHGLAGDDLWLDLAQAPGRDIEQQLSWLASQCVALSSTQAIWGLKLGEIVIAPSQGGSHCQQCLDALARFSGPQE